MLLFCPCKHSTPNDHGGSFYHNHEWKKLNLQYSRVIVSTFVENWFFIDFLFISEKKFTLLKFWPHHNHWDHKLSELVCTLLEDYSTKVSGKICFKNDFFLWHEVITNIVWYQKSKRKIQKRNIANIKYMNICEIPSRWRSWFEKHLIANTISST